MRGFAKKARPSRNNKDDKTPLLNEDLVREIMKQSGASSADEVQLRLVVEESGQTKPTSEATSLANAIQISIDKVLDLVEIDLSQELPVIRAVAYEAKLYKLNKEKAKKLKETSISSTMKQFRFKAKTADHDLQRKLKDVADNLDKGIKCRISTLCPGRLVRSQEVPDGAMAVMERVLEAVSAKGKPQTPPDVNKEKTFATVTLVPISVDSNK